jgi:hypothetical protein
VPLTAPRAPQPEPATTPGTRHYDFHGVRVSVASDSAAVADAVHARLRRFAAGAGRADLAFDFRLCETDARSLEAAAPDARPVYTPRSGTVTYSDATGRLHLDLDERVRAVCDPSAGETRVLARPPADDLTWLLSHAALTLPLVEQLKRRGLYSVHAAAAAVGGRALLVAGPSGAGKSTLALALLRAGVGFLGDDMCFLADGGDGLRVCAFPDEIDVTDDTAALLPELRHLLAAPAQRGWPKRRLIPESVYDVRFVAGCRPGVVVFPRVARAERSVLSPMSRGEALIALAPNVLLTEPRAAQAHLDALARLVEESDCYALATGRDLDALPDLLGALL